jgi:hypothetical protein
VQQQETKHQLKQATETVLQQDTERQLFSSHTSM